LLFATNSTYAIAPHLISPLPYDNRAGFTGISLVGRTPQALCVHPGLPVNNIAEFLAYVRARPEQVSFSSAGIGASSHLASEMLMAIAGLKMLHVPYRGGAPSMQAVVAGETQMSFIDAVSSLPHRAAGTLKLLAVGTATRSSLLPELPTLAESGVAGFDSSTDMALMGPAGLPSVVVERLAGAVRAAVDDPAFRQQMITQGTEPIGGSPAEFDEYWTRELTKWGEVIRSRGIRAAG
jgi:tripartite-type tricarboxylate transporter receptor subunit TctC